VGRGPGPARSALAVSPVGCRPAAVKGRVPVTRLGRVMLGKLKVYAGTAHPHVAQQPRPLPDHI